MTGKAKLMPSMDSEIDLRKTIESEHSVDGKSDSCRVCASKHGVSSFHGIKVCQRCLRCYFRMKHVKHAVPKYCMFTEGNCDIHYLSKGSFCSFCHLEKLYSVGFFKINEEKPFFKKRSWFYPDAKRRGLFGQPEAAQKGQTSTGETSKNRVVEVLQNTATSQVVGAQDGPRDSRADQQAAQTVSKPVIVSRKYHSYGAKINQSLIGDVRCYVCRSSVDKMYGAIVCRACSAFYYECRRGKTRIPTRNDCPLAKGKCTITPETRTHCRYCRLKKCYLAGYPRIVRYNRTSKMVVVPKRISHQLKKTTKTTTGVRNSNSEAANAHMVRESPTTTLKKSNKKCQLCGDIQDVKSVTCRSDIDILLCGDCRQFNRRIPVTKSKLKRTGCTLGEFNCQINPETRSVCGYCRMRKLSRLIGAKRRAKEAKEQMELQSTRPATQIDLADELDEPPAVPLVDLTGRQPTPMEISDETPREVEACGACGDSEHVVTYKGVIICIACRSFFVRMRTKKRPVSCATGLGACEITETTRMSCAYCRCKRLRCLGLAVESTKMRKRKQKAVDGGVGYAREQVANPTDHTVPFALNEVQDRPSVIQGPHCKRPYGLSDIRDANDENMQPDLGDDSSSDTTLIDSYDLRSMSDKDEAIQSTSALDGHHDRHEQPTSENDNTEYIDVITVDDDSPVWQAPADDLDLAMVSIDSSLLIGGGQTNHRRHGDGHTSMATVRHPDSVIEPGDECHVDNTEHYELVEIDCDP